MGNIGIGLTGYEMKLFLKKMKQMGLYSKVDIGMEVYCENFK